MEEQIVNFAQGLDLEPNEIEVFMDTIYDSSKTYKENKELLIIYILRDILEVEEDES